jgi:hypothetical protein
MFQPTLGTCRPQMALTARARNLPEIDLGSDKIAAPARGLHRRNSTLRQLCWCPNYHQGVFFDTKRYSHGDGAGECDDTSVQARSKSPCTQPKGASSRVRVIRSFVGISFHWCETSGTIDRGTLSDILWCPVGFLSCILYPSFCL